MDGNVYLSDSHLGSYFFFPLYIFYVQGLPNCLCLDVFKITFLSRNTDNHCSSSSWRWNMSLHCVLNLSQALEIVLGACLLILFLQSFNALSSPTSPSHLRLSTRWQHSLCIPYCDLLFSYEKSRTNSVKEEVRNEDNVGKKPISPRSVVEK